MVINLFFRFSSFRRVHAARSLIRSCAKHGDLRSHARIRHSLKYIIIINIIICAGTLIIMIIIICILFQTNEMGKKVRELARTRIITVCCESGWRNVDSVDIELIFVLFLLLLHRHSVFCDEILYFIFWWCAVSIWHSLLFFDCGTPAAGFYRISQTIVYQNMLKLMHTHTQSPVALKRE